MDRIFNGGNSHNQSAMLLLLSLLLLPLAVLVHGHLLFFLVVKPDILRLDENVQFGDKETKRGPTKIVLVKSNGRGYSSKDSQ
jgi:hypothetical protein